MEGQGWPSQGERGINPKSSTSTMVCHLAACTTHAQIKEHVSMHRASIPDAFCFQSTSRQRTHIRHSPHVLGRAQATKEDGDAQAGMPPGFACNTRAQGTFKIHQLKNGLGSMHHTRARSLYFHSHTFYEKDTHFTKKNQRARGDGEILRRCVRAGLRISRSPQSSEHPGTRVRVNW